jgi:tetratricopeptide (TPR) repeat protein
MGLAALSIALTALALWGWRRWHTSETATPAVPDIALSSDVDAKLREAIEGARAAVVRQPRSAAAWGQLALLLLANGFAEQAGTCLTAAERLEPAEPRWPYLQAIRLLTGDRDAALPYLQRAIVLCDERDPDNTTPRLLFAEVYLERGQLDEAEALCRQVLERERENPRAHFNLAAIALTRDDLPSAIDHLTRSAASPFARKKASAQLAAVYLRQGDKAKAATWSREADKAPADLLWVDPYIADYRRLEIGRQPQFLEAERAEREGRLAEGLNILMKVANEYPDERSYVALGAALAKIGNHQQAEQVLRRALQASPDKIAALYTLSIVLFRQGEELASEGQADSAAERFRAAAETARRAVKLKPDHALAHMLLGMASNKLGRRDEGMESLRMAVRCRPDFAEVHLQLGEALVADGHKAEALIQLRIAEELAPAEDARPRQALARLRGDSKP